MSEDEPEDIPFEAAGKLRSTATTAKLLGWTTRTLRRQADRLKIEPVIISNSKWAKFFYTPEHIALLRTCTVKTRKKK